MGHIFEKFGCQEEGTEREPLQVLALTRPSHHPGVLQNPLWGQELWSRGTRLLGAPLAHWSWFPLLTTVGWAAGSGLLASMQECEYFRHRPPQHTGYFSVPSYEFSNLSGLGRKHHLS